MGVEFECKLHLPDGLHGFRATICRKCRLNESNDGINGEEAHQDVRPDRRDH